MSITPLRTLTRFSVEAHHLKEMTRTQLSELNTAVVKFSFQEQDKPNMASSTYTTLLGHRNNGLNISNNCTPAFFRELGAVFGRRLLLSDLMMKSYSATV